MANREAFETKSVSEKLPGHTSASSSPMRMDQKVSAEGSRVTETHIGAQMDTCMREPWSPWRIPVPVTDAFLNLAPGRRPGFTTVELKSNHLGTAKEGTIL